ncbi:hypothetical protein HNQ80_000050 [Anaerosolibacter carboniphilus]|uniref:Uncharacterized protein n=1 Tax=Anaerosolibacter carboniphilus TaxID=1417629 RepID=A0A841KL71_9FIRM|nr:hypothetical protein [Anaerosolibacter carboniphilus]MBB6213981.1 hypothetical protein [Anaerosolibacter carboniphilus]
MKHHGHIWLKDGFLGSEILHSNTKCKTGYYRIIFAGAEGTGCDHPWRINFIFSFICTSDVGSSVDCHGASSANMYVVAKPGDIIRFDRYLGILGKETVEYAPNDFGLCDRFYSVQHIKLLQIETDYIQYELHCS